MSKKQIVSIIFSVMLILSGCGASMEAPKKSENTTKVEVLESPSAAGIESIEPVITDEKVEVSSEVAFVEPSTEPSVEPIAEPTASVGIHPAYINILTQVSEIIRSNGDGVVTDGMTGVYEALAGLSVDENLAKMGFLIVDIDGNGVDELIIVDNDERSIPNRILAIYTLSNGNSCLVAEGWFRNRYFMLDDNTIYYEGSGGAAYTLFGTYKIAGDGKSLQAIDMYFSDFKDNDMQIWGWYHNTSGSVEPSESEWLGTDEENSLFLMMEEYGKRVKKLEITTFKDYLGY